MLDAAGRGGHDLRHQAHAESLRAEAALGIFKTIADFVLQTSVRARKHLKNMAHDGSEAVAWVTAAVPCCLSSRHAPPFDHRPLRRGKAASAVAVVCAAKASGVVYRKPATNAPMRGSSLGVLMPWGCPAARWAAVA